MKTIKTLGLILSLSAGAFADTTEQTCSQYLNYNYRKAIAAEVGISLASGGLYPLTEVIVGAIQGKNLFDRFASLKERAELLNSIDSDITMTGFYTELVQKNPSILLSQQEVVTQLKDIELNGVQNGFCAFLFFYPILAAFMPTSLLNYEKYKAKHAEIARAT